MTTRRFLAILVTAALAFGFSWTPAAAQEIETDENPVERPLDDGDFELEPGEEVVHSWALTPAGANEAGASTRPDLSYTGDPGSVIEDAVTVFNLGNQALTFRVYATDAFNATTGDFSLLDGDEPPTDVGTWVEFAQDNVTVEPGRAVTIPITLRIPDDATPGDHVGGILASNEALSSTADGGAIVLDRRTGTRLFVRVNGPLRPELVVEDMSVDYNSSANPLGGSASVIYTIANRGNVRLSGTATASVAGPLGVGKGTAEPLQFNELLPGESVTYEADVDNVPGLGWATATVDIEPPTNAEGTTMQASSWTARTFAPPITLILLGLIVFFFFMARRAYRRHNAPEPEPSWELVVDAGAGEQQQLPETEEHSLT